MTALQSDSVKAIAAALVTVQAHVMIAAKDSDNPFYKSKYADLRAVYEACHGRLSEAGIVVTHGAAIIEGVPVMVTQLTHTSGEWMRGYWPLTPAKSDPQAMGSAITYMRRYSLAAMVGVIADDDDDGNAASGRSANQKAQPPADAKPPLPLLPPERAEAMSRELERLGLGKHDQLQLASATLGKPVSALTQLSEGEALEVWAKAKQKPAA